MKEKTCAYPRMSFFLNDANQHRHEQKDNTESPHPKEGVADVFPHINPCKTYSEPNSGASGLTKVPMMFPIIMAYAAEVPGTPTSDVMDSTIGRRA